MVALVAIFVFCFAKIPLGDTFRLNNLISYRVLLVTAWLISDTAEHSFNFAYRSYRMQKIKILGTRK